MAAKLSHTAQVSIMHLETARVTINSEIDAIVSAIRTADGKDPQKIKPIKVQLLKLYDRVNEMAHQFLGEH